MKQQTLAMAADQGENFERFRRPTRRDEFLAKMDSLVPWADLCAVIEPHYPKAGNGRPPIGLERMLRMYFAHSTDRGHPFQADRGQRSMRSRTP
jgi:IS5 family transposase